MIIAKNILINQPNKTFIIKFKLEIKEKLYI